MYVALKSTINTLNYSNHQCYNMQIKQRVHLPMKLCDQEGIWKTQLESIH